jgi:hypothetical protein
MNWPTFFTSIFAIAAGFFLAAVTHPEAAGVSAVFNTEVAPWIVLIGLVGLPVSTIVDDSKPFLRGLAS